MSQILSLRGDGLRSSRFADKAHSLLTSRWSKASWRMRASILDTVDWLLRLEMADRNETALVNRRMASHKGG